MTCGAPACKEQSAFRIDFEILGPYASGEYHYGCEDREYCPRHMIEQLDFLLTLAAECEKSRKEYLDKIIKK